MLFTVAALPYPGSLGPAVAAGGPPATAGVVEAAVPGAAEMVDGAAETEAVGVTETAAAGATWTVAVCGAETVASGAKEPELWGVETLLPPYAGGVVSISMRFEGLLLGSSGSRARFLPFFPDRL